jgi:hypothetical protein
MKNANSKQFIDVLCSAFRTAVTMATVRDVKQMACKNGTSCKQNLFISVDSINRKAAGSKLE